MLEADQHQEQLLFADNNDTLELPESYYPSNNKPKKMKVISIAVAAFNNIATINVLTFLKFFRSTFLHLRYLGIIGVVAEFANLGFKSYKIANSHLPRHVKIIAGAINAFYSLLLTTAMTATGLAMAKVLAGIAGKIVSAVATSSPFIFTFALGSLALINGYGLITRIKEHVQKPWTRTPSNYLRMASKATKCIAYSGMTAVYIPLFATMGMVALAAGITAGGPIFWGVLAAGFTVLTVWKISKHIIQKKIENGLALKASRAALDPFEILKIDNQAPDWKKNLQTRYDNAVQNVIQQRKWEELNSEDKQSLTKIQNAYELLKSERAVLLYNALNSVKDLVNTRKFCPYKVLNYPQNSRSFLDRFMPFSLKAWWSKKTALTRAETKQKKAEIELAYQIMSNNCLKEYYDECVHQAANRCDNKLENCKQNPASYLKTVKALQNNACLSSNANQINNEIIPKEVSQLHVPKVEYLTHAYDKQSSSAASHYLSEIRLPNDACLHASQGAKNC